MGSSLRLTILGEDGDAAWAEVVDEFAASDQALSRFRDDAELVALDRAAGTGIALHVGWRLERAVVLAERGRRVTSGRFDARVLQDLERLGEHGAEMTLDASARNEEKERSWMGRALVRRLSPGYLSLDQPIDLGGIGKGLALRWAARRCARLGLGGSLIDAGGDIVVDGAGPEAGAWQIGIEDPLARDGGPLAVVRLREQAIATSSISRRTWEHEGRLVHHLIEPTSGLPAWTGLLAVTVAWRDPAWAEVWAKSLFLGGAAAIGVEARRRGLAAWWVVDDGTLEMTPAARELTMWVAGEDQPPGVTAASSSSSVGMPSRAPAFVTARDAAATARRAASSTG
jgi:thiamine biosynthesis lipoprotein